jgi:hypothetical protein
VDYATVLRLSAAGAALTALLAGSAARAATVTEYLVSPAAAHFPQNKQNESPMAVNPVDPANAISGANDEIEEPDCTLTSSGSSSCPFDPHTNVSGVYVTTDGGTHWSQQILHWGTSGLSSDGDPAVAFGPKPNGHGGFSYASGARAYFGSLATSPAFGPNQELLAVAHSDDKGATWSAPVLATTRTNPVEFNDKIAVWADASPSSPFFGNVYVSWTLFTGQKGVPEPIMAARSVDGGLSFSRPRQLTPASDNAAVGGRQGSTIRTAPDGSVYVFWEGAASHHSAILGARSADGGVSFGRPFLVSFVSDLPSALPGASFRTDSFPLADIDAAGQIFIVWADYSASHQGIVKLATSTNNGGSWTTTTAATVSGRNAFYPAVAASYNKITHGSKVFIGFSALDQTPDGTAPGAGVAQYDAYYVLSTNGAAFGTPTKISAASSDPDASSSNDLTGQFLGDYNGAAAGSDGSFWFAWTDTRNGMPCTAIDMWRAGVTATEPNIASACDPTFGNSDIYVAHVVP